MQSKQNSNLEVIESGLALALSQKARALPSDFNSTRFVQNAVAVLKSMGNDIQKVDPASAVECLIRGAFLDLDFFLKECYAIPYKSGDKITLNFQTDYKGERKLARKYGNVKDVYSLLIHKSEALPRIKVINGIQSVEFESSGKYVKGPEDCAGVVSFLVWEDGGFQYEVMTTEEIEHIRSAYSKAPNSPAWGKSWGEMAKKTALRRILKNIHIDFQTSEALEAFWAGGDTDVEQLQAPKPELPELPTPEPEKTEDATYMTDKGFSAMLRAISEHGKKALDNYNPEDQTVTTTTGRILALTDAQITELGKALDELEDAADAKIDAKAAKSKGTDTPEAKKPTEPALTEAKRSEIIWALVEEAGAQGVTVDELTGKDLAGLKALAPGDLIYLETKILKGAKK